MQAAVVIPVRMASTRFPGKPLALILGRSMLEHVFLRAAMAEAIDGVYVATCDDEIRRAAEAFGATVIMTSLDHERASDRVAEAARSISADVIVMVQGDEPMLHPDMVTAALAPFREAGGVVCVNLTTKIGTREEFEDRNTIKVVMGENHDALYFSREPIPTRTMSDFERIPRFKQVCVIPFTAEGLQRFASLDQTSLERAESIDMLRFLENGMPVRMVETSFVTHAVDTPEDLALVESLMKNDPLLDRYPSAADQARP